MKRALLCTLIAAALLLSACTRASESTVRAPDAGAPLTLCLGAGPAAPDPARPAEPAPSFAIPEAVPAPEEAAADLLAELCQELCRRSPASRAILSRWAGELARGAGEKPAAPPRKSKAVKV